MKDGKYIEKVEVIMTTPDEVDEKPAGYSFKYGELCELPDAP